MKRIIVCVLLVCMVFTCHIIYATSENEEIIQQARKHISQHNDIPSEIVNCMAVTREWNPDHKEWVCSFSFFDFSEKLFEIWISEEGVHHCNCKQFTQENINKGIEYYYSVLPSVIALEKLEKRNGPHQLWNVAQNAYFYSEYDHIPCETQLSYELGLSHYDLPYQEDLAFDIAILKSNSILSSHLQADNDYIPLLKIGSAFIRSDSDFSYYSIKYYMQDEKGELVLQYVTRITSPEGLCLSSQKCTDIDSSPFPPDYWSDIYTYIEQEDGSYVRITKEK